MTTHNNKPNNDKATKPSKALLKKAKADGFALYQELGVVGIDKTFYSQWRKNQQKIDSDDAQKAHRLLTALTDYSPNIKLRNSLAISYYKALIQDLGYFKVDFKEGNKILISGLLLVSFDEQTGLIDATYQDQKLKIKPKDAKVLINHILASNLFSRPDFNPSLTFIFRRIFEQAIIKGLGLELLVTKKVLDPSVLSYLTVWVLSTNIYKNKVLLARMIEKRIMAWLNPKIRSYMLITNARSVKDANYITKNIKHIERLEKQNPKMLRLIQSIPKEEWVNPEAFSRKNLKAGILSINGFLTPTTYKKIQDLSLSEARSLMSTLKDPMNCRQNPYTKAFFDPSMEFDPTLTSLVWEWVFDALDQSKQVLDKQPKRYRSFVKLFCWELALMVPTEMMGRYNGGFSGSLEWSAIKPMLKQMVYARIKSLAQVSCDTFNLRENTRYLARAEMMDFVIPLDAWMSGDLDLTAIKKHTSWAYFVRQSDLWHRLYNQEKNLADAITVLANAGINIDRNQTPRKLLTSSFLPCRVASLASARLMLVGIIVHLGVFCRFRSFYTSDAHKSFSSHLTTDNLYFPCRFVLEHCPHKG